jgi:hypothetical protein
MAVPTTTKNLEAARNLGIATPVARPKAASGLALVRFAIGTDLLNAHVEVRVTRYEVAAASAGHVIVWRRPGRPAPIRWALIGAERARRRMLNCLLRTVLAHARRDKKQRDEGEPHVATTLSVRCDGDILCSSAEVTG